MSSDDHRSLTETILGAVFEVSNTLGPGFLERVYARALALELRIRGLSVASEVSYDVVYKSELIGQYYADLVVNDTVVVELKCTDHLSNDHLAQCLNYLKASRLPLCLLINFQRAKVEWKRVVLTHSVFFLSAFICVHLRLRHLGL